MKELNKWLDKKRSPEELLRISVCTTSEKITDVIAETAWRAALEMVAQKIRWGDGFSPFDVLVGIENDIKEELES